MIFHIFNVTIEINKREALEKSIHHREDYIANYLEEKQMDIIYHSGLLN